MPQECCNPEQGTEFQNAQTTPWSQKQSSLSASETRYAFHSWKYLANGQVTASMAIEGEAAHTLTKANCFCDHSGLLVDFGNLEALDLSAIRIEMDAIAHDLGEAYRRLVLGTANKLLWHWGECTGAIARGENGRLEVDKAIALVAIGVIPFSAVADGFVTLIFVGAIADTIHMLKDNYSFPEEVVWGR